MQIGLATDKVSVTFQKLILKRVTSYSTTEIYFGSIGIQFCTFFFCQWFRNATTSTKPLEDIDMSRTMKTLLFAIAKKASISCAVTGQLIGAIVFAK